MPVVTFQNPGLIDLRAIKFMGVSAKDGDNPIGYFGTGLKYAIAVLLREGQEIILWRGEEKFVFSAKFEEIRGKTFRLIYMNDQPLGITDELGKNWQMWQVFRELEANCRDEGGVTLDMALPRKADCTTICVYGSEFHKQYLDRDKIFINRQRQPIIKLPEIEVYEGKTSSVYFRGVRAFGLLKSSLYTYNLLEGELTEDRTIGSPWRIDWAVTNAFCHSEHREFIQTVAKAKQGDYESGIDFVGSFGHPSERTMDLLGEMKSHLSVHAFKLWCKHCPDAEEFKTFVPSGIEQAMLAKAIVFCQRLGADVTAYEIKFAETLGENCLGRALRPNIWIAHKAFQMGTKQLAGTLFEEWLHLEHALEDCTRSMQNWLFDKIMSMGEEAAGEPL